MAIRSRGKRVDSVMIVVGTLALMLGLWLTTRLMNTEGDWGYRSFEEGALEATAALLVALGAGATFMGLFFLLAPSRRARRPSHRRRNYGSSFEIRRERYKSQRSSQGMKGDAGVAHADKKDLLWGVLLVLAGVLIIDAYLLWVDMYRPDLPVPWGGIGFILIFLGLILLIAGVLQGRRTTQRKGFALRKSP